MKKIMFSDKFGLTESVLSGRKTQTRRILPKSIFQFEHDIDEDKRKIWIEDMYGDWYDVRESKYCYKVGEIVAVAQSYKDFGANCLDSRAMTNKMFVKAKYMPHQIRITDVRVERLQDISEEDCIKELGLDYVSRNMGYGNAMSEWVYQFRWDDKLGRIRECSHRNPREVFATMIDKICGKGTWKNNPYVFVYDFELIK